MNRTGAFEPPQRWVLFAILTGIAVIARLASLQWLHPLQWDEVEYFRATDWVRQGLLPYRDFWEHHTPLQWFVFAPVAALTSSEGVGAIVLMRWAQVPVWIATFGLLLIWMRRADLSPDARWAAVAIAAGSSLFMIPAVEYRIEPLGCALFVGGMVLAQDAERSRRIAFAAGVVFCLSGLANIRLGPLLAFTVLLLRFVDPAAGRWRSNVRAQWVWAGASMALVAAALFLAGTGVLRPMYEQVWVGNYLGDRYAPPVSGALLHRLLAPFGVRLLAGASRFDPMAVDIGGAFVLIAGTVGLVVALARWRRPDHLFVLAAVHLVSVLFTLRMKRVYVYHFEIIVLLSVPLLAALFSRWEKRRVIAVIAALAVGVSSFAAIFRGKEADRAYQDLVMRAVHDQTGAGEKVFDGVGWALRRQPAYRFWFLPELARQLVGHGHAAPYAAQAMLADPPAAIIADQNALVWLSNDRELAAAAVRHYVPLLRNLWVPGMSGAVAPGGSATWVVPRDGTYKVVASPELAKHPWFSLPLLYASSFGPENDIRPLALDVPAERRLAWTVNGVAAPEGLLKLRRGQTLAVTSTADTSIGVFVVRSSMTVAFVQPPPNVSLDAAGARVTHVPRFGLRFGD